MLFKVKLRRLIFTDGGHSVQQRNKQEITVLLAHRARNDCRYSHIVLVVTIATRTMRDNSVFFSHIVQVNYRD